MQCESLSKHYPSGIELVRLTPTPTKETSFIARAFQGFLDYISIPEPEVGPHTSIVAILRKHGEVPVDFVLDIANKSRQPDHTFREALLRLEQDGAVQFSRQP